MGILLDHETLISALPYMSATFMVSVIPSHVTRHEVGCNALDAFIEIIYINPLYRIQRDRRNTNIMFDHQMG